MRRPSLIALVGSLAFAATTFAGPVKAKEAWASGQIERVDAAAKSVVVKQGAHEMTFVLADNVHLQQGGKALRPRDLSSDVGRHVKVRYTLSGTNKVADRLEIAQK